MIYFVAGVGALSHVFRARSSADFSPNVHDTLSLDRDAHVSHYRDQLGKTKRFVFET